MFSIIVFLFLYVCNCQRPFVFGTDAVRTYPLPRIVGGEVCNVTKYPFVVSLFNIVNKKGDNFLCGGTLVSLQWVLTAAHCFFPKGLDVIVTSGFAEKKYYQEREAQRHVLHQRYDPKKEFRELRFDIALVLLKQPFKKGPACDFVVLPTPGFTRDCRVGKVLGIGKEKIVRPRQFEWFEGIKLKCVDLHIIDTKTCSRENPGFVVDNTVICTMESKGGKDACEGDSGGPLLCRDKVIIGIVSTGIGCGIANKTATFTNVESYLSFISSVTRSTRNRTKPRYGLTGKYRTNTTSKGGRGEIFTLMGVTGILFLVLPPYIFS